MGLLTRLDRFLVKFEEILLALLLVALIVLAATQVLLRNIWSTSIDWADVTLQNATVLIALLGAAIATSEGRHLNIDLVGRALRGRKRLMVNILIGVFGVITCALLTRGGWQTFRANYEPWVANVPAGWSKMRLLRQELGEGSFPQWLSQLMLPGGFGLIGLHFFLRLARDLSWLMGGDDGAALDHEQDGDAYLDRIVASTEGELGATETGAPEVPTVAPDGAALSDEAGTATEDEQEDKTTAAMTPKHRRELATKPPSLASTKDERRGEPRVGASSELDEATVSDALSDTLVPTEGGEPMDEASTDVDEADTLGAKDKKVGEEEEAQTLFDPDLQDQLASAAPIDEEGDDAEAPTDLARVRTDSTDIAEAATELALPRDDDEEEKKS